MELMIAVAVLLRLLSSTLAEDSGSAQDAETVFKTLFRQKRVEQLTAVQHLLKLVPEKQAKLLDSMLDQIMTILLKGRTHLEMSGFIPGNNFPDDEKTRNALALVMENTCFLSDVFLRFPDFLHQRLQGRKEWDMLFKWSLTFVEESALIDEATKKLIDLASQEAGVREKHPNYVNPYKVERKKQKKLEDLPPKKKKEKKKIKRGPKLSRSDEL